MKLFLCLSVVLFLSCDEIIMEEDISAYQLNLVAPANNSVFSSTSISFNWESIEGVGQYRLQVARPNFESPQQIVLDTVVSSAHFQYQINVGEYQWRVKAQNSSYQSSYSSRYFSVISNEDFQSNSVILQSPSNNFIDNSLTHSLSWIEVIGATAYEMQIYNSSNTVISTQSVSSTSVNYTFPEGSFSWRVRATNGSQTTLYASRNILTDITLPNTPQLISPLNNSQVNEGQVAFQWNRTPISGSIERDSIYIYSNSSMTSLHSKYLGNGSTLNVNLNSGNYFWVTRAFDQAGNVGAQSSMYSVTVN